jgi:hypothetical protein
VSISRGGNRLFKWRAERRLRKDPQLCEPLDRITHLDARLGLPENASATRLRRKLSAVCLF